MSRHILTIMHVPDEFDTEQAKALLDDVRAVLKPLGQEFRAAFDDELDEDEEE